MAADTSAEWDELTVVVAGGARRVALTIWADRAAPTAEVLAELLRVAEPMVGPVSGPLLVDGAPLAGGARWASSGVRHGSVLSLVREPPSRDFPLELRVVAGPAAGAVLPLGAGAVVIGRAVTCDVVLDDEEVSRRHAEISMETHGLLRVRDLGSTNGVAVDGEAVTSAPLPPGALVTIGESQLVLCPRRVDPAALDDSPGAGRRFDRPPRAAVAPGQDLELVTPLAPVALARGRIPWVTVAVPLALGAVLFVTMRSSPQYLLLMAMSPLMMIANLLSDRRGGRRGLRKAQREYRVAVASVDAARRNACAADERLRRAEAPDPAELLGRATLPSSRLWERRRSDTDALSLRLGVADLPARVRLRAAPGGGDRPAGDGPMGDTVPLARSVPVVLSLDEVGVLGIVGADGQTSALARWLVGQAAILLAPSDLTVVVLTTAARCDGWEWLRWLPHAGSDEPAACKVLVGHDPSSWAARVAELSRLVAARSKTSSPRVLLVLDGARDLRQVPGLSALLADGPTAGVRVICRDAEERLLPQECATVATFEPGSSTRLRLRGRDGRLVTDVLADQVSLPWAETVSQALAGLEDGSAASAVSGGLPRMVRLLDLVGLPVPTADEVAAGWRRVGRSTAAVIGVGPDGPLSIDLARDGPHALVAGTTGAGKSELLQTLVASLALANRPDALTFVLVDYKGGAAFRDCARLPHTVGLVTDLDGRLTERALASLSAELRRRERVLAEHGVKDLETLLVKTSRDNAPPLPRLVIVIDEFATLVEELPEFVRGLVGIAQRGRSLGIHLVLATQRPGGVVSPDIRANTNLRICLRVTQTGESSDVVDAPDAGEIPAGLAGRGVIRTGAGALQAFQAARVGGVAPVSSSPESPLRVAAIPLAALAEPEPPLVAADDDDGATDLSLLVDAVCSAFDSLGLPAPRRPWLDALPALLVLNDVPSGDCDLPLGLLDLPSRQQRLPYGLRLADPGHLMVVGAARSGRSTALQTLAGTVARDWSPDDLHLYGLDFGNHSLAPLVGLPHCGAVVGRDQPERLDRLLSRLSAEVERRHAVLAAGGYADLAEQRRLAAPAERLPWLLLLVDRWEAFVAVHQDVEMGRRVEELLRLLREGPSLGLKAVITADRSGLLGRLPTVVQDKLVLRLADRGDYGLADIPAREAPVSPPPGRGLVVGQGESRTFHEVQIALLTADPAGPAQLAALRSLVDGARLRRSGRPPRHRPIRVDPLPPAVSVFDALSLGATTAEAAGLWALIGVGGDQLRPIGVDLSADGPGFLVVGAPRSGRSTALITMTESLLRSGRSVCLVAPRRSPLSSLADHPGVTACLDATATDEQARRAVSSTGASTVVVVDDAEWLTDSPLGLVLEEQLRAEPGQGAYVLAAGNSEDLQNTYRGFTVGLRRSRCGLLLNPQSTLDGDLVGARLPRQLSPARHAGRALLAVRGDLTPVQVAQR
jgi:DNA segregation ATPase FtsK/SpoIIIE, S-DNA-T family